jgi:hypothetical protein
MSKLDMFKRWWLSKVQEKITSALRLVADLFGMASGEALTKSIKTSAGTRSKDKIIQSRQSSREKLLSGYRDRQTFNIWGTPGRENQFCLALLSVWSPKSVYNDGTRGRRFFWTGWQLHIASMPCGKFIPFGEGENESLVCFDQHHAVVGFIGYLLYFLVRSASSPVAGSLGAAPPLVFASPLAFKLVESLGSSLVKGRNSGWPGMYFCKTLGMLMPSSVW